MDLYEEIITEEQQDRESSYNEVCTIMLIQFKYAFLFFLNPQDCLKWNAGTQLLFPLDINNHQYPLSHYS